MPDVNLLFGQNSYSIYTKVVGEIIKRYDTIVMLVTPRCIRMALKPGENWDDISSSVEACLAEVGYLNANNMNSYCI